ncbi:hypothetical protein [Poseidonocella sp. HB161398]|uniref:hypothetical protein n=1 Tax=Poseidonocella sp. HB161398 TaxID=2320855 RepID=UPI001108CAC9|nr:hypothetical protein [Poseidonocella sp. HB161398]
MIGVPPGAAALMAGILAKLNATLPEGAFDPARGGHAISPALQALAAEALAVTGEDGTGDEAAAALSARAAEILEADYGRAQVALIEDPQIAALLPLFGTAAATAGRQLRLLLVHDAGTPTGDLLAAEAATRGLSRCIIGLPLLARTPVESLAAAGRALDLSWPRSARSAEDEIAALLEGQPEPGTAEGALEIFARWQIAGEDPADHAALDALRGAPADEPAPSGAGDAAPTDLAALQAKLAEMEAALAESRSAEADARDRAEALSAELGALRQDVAEQETARNSLQMALQAEFRQAGERLEAEKAAHAATTDELAVMRSALTQREHERDDLHRELMAAIASREALERRQEESAARIAQLESRLDQNTRQLTALSRRAAAQVQKRVGAAQDLMDGAGGISFEEMLKQRDRQVDEARAEMDGLRAEIGRMESNAEHDGRIRSELKETLRRRETELVEQIAQRRALTRELDVARNEAARIRSQIADEQDNHDRATEALKAEHEKLVEELSRQSDEQRLRLEEWILAMENSTSWRATKPLRSVITMLRQRKS